MIIDHPTPEQVPALRTLWREVFGDTEIFLDAFTATAMDANRCLAAMEGDELLGSLYWFDCSCRGRRLAYVYGVATAQAHRGKGICHKLMEQLHHRLAARDYAGTVLVPGEEGLFRFYESMGYRTFCGVTDFPCAPDGEAIGLYGVEPAEYGRLRKTLLPEGGVVQERENLDFLATQARLYAGTGFVLAARKEGQKLLGLELLGDKATAPGILTALGCGEGLFRVFGEGRPFAMYRPLTDAPAPSYFALAFD